MGRPLNVAAVVVAAGRGERFGPGPAKQFRDLAGRTVLARSVAALVAHVDGVAVVLPPGDADGPRGEEARALPGVRAVTAGGATRAASVLRGLEATGGADLVLVHDAARPLVPAHVVRAVLEATRAHGAAVPVIPVPDTVKEAGPDPAWVGRTVDRAALRLAQTPQGARADWLREALRRAAEAGEDPTDEAMALERAGHPVRLVPGDPSNVKITRPEDLDAARRALARGLPDLRVGTGFDVHRFGGERPLVLGGVRFEGETGLLGHSDADVVLHAAMDALLGAAALPDIGALFPPGDPRFAGADSSGLARTVAGRVRDAGWEPVSLDLTVLAERPRIRARVEAMREAVAAAFGMDPGRVGLKATTLEGLGALGRAEGIACQAAALLGRREPA